ncbi:TetR family transcriptional regulator [Prescottella equi]|nr:TetR family transcriptional regulator [Prescottella equi]BCN49313.1 TetR family transcriptional regulator [Prescottella equi]BCN59278.1 TetR family transcriptional regulator [Prescottella equi]BCN69102.1 TetR family transcriptional regulator [Prescottella equi]BDC72800.1 TetR family transcriptional regulator [Prescottella equi]
MAGMGRPRGFDEVAVLDASAEQFRVHGFADTSTEQLCDAAGVRRSSLYNTFTSKDELFVRSLERSVAVAKEQQESVLTDVELSGAERLTALFALVLDEERQARKNGHAAGCMVVSTHMAPDVGAREPRVKDILDRFLADQLALVADAVRAGRLDGTLRTDLAPKQAALMVVSAISGIRVLAQAGTMPAELRKVADLHIDSLRA